MEGDSHDMSDVPLPASTDPAMDDPSTLTEAGSNKLDLGKSMLDLRFRSTKLY